MKGEKLMFVGKPYFYKEYTPTEFNCLVQLHGSEMIQRTTIDGIEYIRMPYGTIISADTIPADKRATSGIRSLIRENTSFMLEQIRKLNGVGIYYSDYMQWLLIDNKMHLVDFDTAYIVDDLDALNNLFLFAMFLKEFSVDSAWLSEALEYFALFNSNGGTLEFCDIEKQEVYKSLHNADMTYNHIYFCRHERYIQIKAKHAHIYGKTGNMVITEDELSPEVVDEWELIQVI